VGSGAGRYLERIVEPRKGTKKDRQGEKELGEKEVGQKEVGQEEVGERKVGAKR
jgi:hypothetical protein